MKNTNCYAILTRWCYNAGMSMSDKYPHLFGKLITDVNKLPDGAAHFNDCIEAIEEAEKTEKRVGIANNNRKNRRD